MRQDPPWTLRGCLTVCPYESFPDVFLRSGRKKGHCIDVASESDVRMALIIRLDVEACPEIFHIGPKYVVLWTSCPNSTH